MFPFVFKYTILNFYLFILDYFNVLILKIKFNKKNYFNIF